MSDLTVKIKTRNLSLIFRWLLLIPLILSGVWFYYLEKHILVPQYLLHTQLDDYIPFVPLFVLPYLFWYIYVTVPAVFLFFKSPREFVRTAIFLTLGMVIACTIYMLFPNGQALRPDLSGNNGIFSGWIKTIYSHDTPINCAPSIHVIYSAAAYFAVTFYNNNRKKIVWINIASLIAAVLCILSTVFIKQHSVIDVVLGLIVSLLLYYVIYRVKAKKAYEISDAQKC